MVWRGGSYERTSEEILVVIGMFCFLTLSTSVSRWQYTVSDKMGKGYRRALLFVSLFFVFTGELSIISYNCMCY